MAIYSISPNGDKAKCGCSATTVNNDIVVYHCPVHAAGPKLLDACQFALTTLSLGYNAGDGQAAELLRAAITQVEGQEATDGIH